MGSWLASRYLETLSLWAAGWPVSTESHYCYGQLAVLSRLRVRIAMGSWLAYPDLDFVPLWAVG
ncbi:hypothetical protein DPMN_044574 [Dreissena polymorpha]|uniref:Uncharacterized protein n=1 Tax=Dreissena polymorpha TaxID=45954 RepID=A0A9D4D633_DREPO|nr:hypothetical protein DPMN_044574 [Dreissena polymorpha]